MKHRFTRMYETQQKLEIREVEYPAKRVCESIDLQQSKI